MIFLIIILINDDTPLKIIVKLNLCLSFIIHEKVALVNYE